MAWLALYSPDAEIPRARVPRHFSFRVKAEVIKRHKALREAVNLGPRKVAVVAVASTSS